MAPQPFEVIDLTLGDDDDDDAPAAPSHASINNGRQGSQARPHSSHAHPHAPGSAPQVSDERPAKRPKLDDAGLRPAYSAVSPIACAGAKQAVHEDPRLIESVLQRKLQDALFYQFRDRITQELAQHGDIQSILFQEILAARRDLLRQLVTLEDCRQPATSVQTAQRVPPIPLAPATATPAIPKPWPAAAAIPSNARLLAPAGGGPPQAQAQATKPSNSWMPTNGLLGFQVPLMNPSTTPIAPPRQVVDLTDDVRAPAARSPAVPIPAAHGSRLQVRGGYTNVQQSPVPVPAPWTFTTQTPDTYQRPVSRDTTSRDGPATTPRQTRRRNMPSTPASEARTNVNAPTTPQNFHARAKTAQWKSDKSNMVKTTLTSYFALDRRPYVGTKGKEAILGWNGRLIKLKPTLLRKAEVFHVDFVPNEVDKLYKAARKALKRSEKASSDPYRDLEKLLRRLKEPQGDLARLARQVSLELPAREEDDVLAFLNDIWNKRVVAQEQQILTVEKDPFDTRGEDLHNGRLASILLAREISGNKYGSTRRLENYTNEFRKLVESSLQIRSEFTGCGGDVSTVSWISEQAYVAGTTVHMDSHNQQYNKPGNLVLGSVSRGKAALKAYADHRIVRPLVEKGENSTAAMRESQDPWLYTSVVFSDYDHVHKRLYTCSFDKTVKAWKAEESGASMRCIGTWIHRGPVNFVQASLFHNNGAGKVATASDVPSDAVRIYEVLKDDYLLPTSPFTSYSCSRIMDADGTPLVTDKWTYFPSTMKWGIEKSVQQYLLVGYSPRSITGDDGDIPPERLNTGELCLWDASTGDRIVITSAKTQNVFEVLWHPTQPYFIAATSPKGADWKDNQVRTQVRIFRRNLIPGMEVSFSEWKALDCMAADINELSIMPNSVIYCYVTAGCTNGKTYVWDTALSDKPIQVLSHGPPKEGIRINDAEDDTGVKFTAWGSSLDRFYTGSSDGVVKVWNVRSGGKAKGKVILEAYAQISAGAFSPDRSRLIIGDASGCIFVLSVDEDDGKPPAFVKLPGGTTRRIPTQVEPHASGAVERSGVSIARDFIAARQLRYTGDPTVGAVQDVNYASTKLFLRDFHFLKDPTMELLGQHTAYQQDDAKLFSYTPSTIKRLRRLTYTPIDANEPVDPEEGRQALLKRHEENCKLDLKFESLTLEIRDVLSSSGIGQQELLEGPEYPGIVEDDEAEFRSGEVEIPKEAVEEPGF